MLFYVTQCLPPCSPRMVGTQRAGPSAPVLSWDGGQSPRKGQGAKAAAFLRLVGAFRKNSGQSHCS